MNLESNKPRGPELKRGDIVFKAYIANKKVEVDPVLVERAGSKEVILESHVAFRFTSRFLNDGTLHVTRKAALEDFATHCRDSIERMKKQILDSEDYLAQAEARLAAYMPDTEAP